MTWQNFYMFCFLIGFLWGLLSLLVGHLHIGLPIHHGNGGGCFHHAAAGVHHGAHAVHTGAKVGNGSSNSSHLPPISVSPLNLGTIAAFLAWFGGAGYLLSAYSSLWFVWSLLLSLVTGLAGASLIFWFLAKVLVGTERNLNPADYRRTGILGHVSSSIRESGTGEIIYSQEGTRRA
jgi:hypothetical protein